MSLTGYQRVPKERKAVPARMKLASTDVKPSSETLRTVVGNQRPHVSDLVEMLVGKSANCVDQQPLIVSTTLVR